jgi:hypothetical protein
VLARIGRRAARMDVLANFVGKWSVPGRHVIRETVERTSATSSWEPVTRARMQREKDSTGYQREHGDSSQRPAPPVPHGVPFNSAKTLPRKARLVG